jgi:hypothetical protein
MGTKTDDVGGSWLSVGPLLDIYIKWPIKRALVYWKLSVVNYMYVWIRHGSVIEA